MSVVYENGDTEEVAIGEVLRDGLLSLGWVQPECPSCPSSEVASAAGKGTIVGPHLQFACPYDSMLAVPFA